MITDEQLAEMDECEREGQHGAMQYRLDVRALIAEVRCLRAALVEIGHSSDSTPLISSSRVVMARELLAAREALRAADEVIDDYNETTGGGPGIDAYFALRAKVPMP